MNNTVIARHALNPRGRFRRLAVKAGGRHRSPSGQSKTEQVGYKKIWHRREVDKRDDGRFAVMNVLLKIA